MKNSISIPLVVATMMIPLSTYPTCIAILKLNNTIFVAADTRRVFDNGLPPATISKIHHSGKYYYADAGLITPDISSICDGILIQNKPIAEKLKTIGKALTIYLDTAVNNRKEISEKRYNNFIRAGVLSLAFFFSESNTVHLDNIDLYLKPSKRGYRIKDSIRIDMTASSNMGYRDLYNSPEELAIRKGDAVTYVTNFVKLEMSHHPNEIGCPIERLVMDSTGQVEWLPRDYCN